MLSDSDSSDSDCGIRFKTASTRNRESFPKQSTSNGDLWRSENRQEPQDRRRVRSPSREKQHRNAEYRRSRSVERSQHRDHRIHKSSDPHRSDRTPEQHDNKRVHSRDERKREEKLEKSIRVPTEKSTAIDELAEKSKLKRSKHKKHKRSKRDDKDELKSTETDQTINENLIKTTKEPLTNQRQTVDEDIDPSSVCGPSLPPHLRLSDDNETFKQSNSDQNNSKSVRIMGPSAPPPSYLIDQSNTLAMSDISESEDDSLIGPIPIDSTTTSEIHLELEKRAIELKLAQFDEGNRKNTQIKEREEWMLELPQVRSVADGGLGARVFRKNERPDMSDRSQWTDIPNEKAQKKGPTVEQLQELHQKEAEKNFNARRDKEQEAAAKRYKKKHKRSESLLDIHQKKLKRNKEKTTAKPERRPFSRETDLQVNRFDQAKKNAILKKAQLLDTRFGSGETKYL